MGGQLDSVMVWVANASPARRDIQHLTRSAYPFARHVGLMYLVYTTVLLAREDWSSLSNNVEYMCSPMVE